MCWNATVLSQWSKVTNTMNIRKSFESSILVAHDVVTSAHTNALKIGWKNIGKFLIIHQCLLLPGFYLYGALHSNMEYSIVQITVKPALFTGQNFHKFWRHSWN